MDRSTYQHVDEEQLPDELVKVFSMKEGPRSAEDRRRDTEEAPEGPEEKYSVLVEQARDGVVIIQDGVYKFANKAMREISGYPIGEMAGMHFLDMVTPECRELVAGRHDLLKRGLPVPPVYEVRIRCRNGEEKHVQLSAATVRYAGRPASMAIVRDITEQERAKERLRNNELWFRSLYEQSPIGIVLHDSNGGVIGINRACLDIFGIDHLDPASASKLFQEPDLPTRAKSILAQGKTVEYSGPFNFRKARGGLVSAGCRRSGVIHIHVLITPIVPEPDGPVMGYLSQIQDITEHKQADDRLRDLTRRLVEVQELERRHIASELHDQIGQSLTGLKLALETAIRLPPEGVRPILSRAQAAINELMAAVKSMSLDLRPSMLDDLGLLPTLVWHFKRYTAQTGVRVAFGHTGLPRRFAPETETASYRIIQEALTNVARHAHVEEATVRLFATLDSLSIEIEDRGMGFDVKKSMAAGMSSGLLGMRERAVSLGGRLAIESVPGCGTRLTAEFPLAEI